MKTLFLIALCLLPAFLCAQTESPLEYAEQLIEQKQYRQARRALKTAYQTANNNDDIEAIIEVRLKQAELLAITTNSFNRKGNTQKARALLQEAAQNVKATSNDSLNLLLASQISKLKEMGLEIELPTPLRPGGQASINPKIKDLAIKRAKQINDYGDSLNAQLALLQIEKGQLEEEINALSLEQARQELILARKEKALDSINMSRMQDSLLVTQQQMKLEQQRNQLSLKEAQRNRSRIISVAIILLAGVLFWLYFNSRKKNKIIEEERARSEDLLLNILPVAVAEELKAKGTSTARLYNEATVLFSDFKGFTNISNQLSPQELVKELDECFKAFDQIVEKHGLEKIKTIGDAYMCAAGLPEESADHATRTIKAALEMQEWLANTPNRALKEARIGVHTGPVIAGVVGARKFAYDIWGLTVNVAARMESQSEPGQVNISQSTYEKVKDSFALSPRGKLPAKGIGEVEMYFVNKEVLPEA
jgi:class 3 adenylate cyclase